MQDVDYIEYLDEKLRPRINDRKPIVLDLFAGCGGLSLGFESLGFKTVGYEMDKQCCETYNLNLEGNCINEKLSLDFDFPKAEVIIGGPPCQPFSVGGKQLGLKDSRDGFPIFIKAVKQSNPEVFVIENVRGLLYRNKKYLNEIINEFKKLGYLIEYRLLTASNYEVPQKRQRVFIIGHKGGYKFPNEIKNKITSGKALGDLAFSIPENSRFLTKSMDEYIARYEKASQCKTPRDLHLDQPARTLTCRNLHGATADMMRIKLPDGRRRMLQVREAARLQSFPDWFEFLGTESQKFDQIGNAVPPMLAYHIAISINKYLQNDSTFGKAKIFELNSSIDSGNQYKIKI